MNIYFEAGFYFFIYGFLGWCVEVCYHAIDKGMWVNRGFLNGAICPIYGLGVMFMADVFARFVSHGVILFIASLIFCTTLELVAGFVLFKAFHQRWWDYSEEKYNLGGYICLRFSIIWGLACTFVIKLIHPLIRQLVSIIYYRFEIAGWIILGLLAVIFFIDLTATVTQVAGLARKLKQLDEAADQIKKMSNELTGMLYDNSIMAKDEFEDAEEDLKERSAELKKDIRDHRQDMEEELQQYKEKYEERKHRLAGSLSYTQRRIMRAYPKIRSLDYKEVFEELKEKVKEI